MKHSVDRALPLAAVFLAIFGSKSWLIAALGSPLPYSDQWDLEGTLLAHYLANTLDWPLMLSAINEHRIVFTRMLSIGLFEVAGGWDPIFEMVINSMIQTTFATLFIAATAAIVPERFRLAYFAFSAFCFALPLGFENTLLALNSHFPMLLLFSLASILLIVPSHALSLGWLAGLAFAIAADFTLGSGALTSVATGVVTVAQIARGARSPTPREFAGVALLAATGVTLLATAAWVSGNEVASHSVTDFVVALAFLLTAPLPIVGIGIHLPIAWFTLSRLHSPRPMTDASWIVIAMAVWVGGQMVAIAYGRGQEALTSRFLDTIIILLPLDLAALCVAWGDRSFLPLDRRKKASLAWLAVLIITLGGGSYFWALRSAVDVRSQLDDMAGHVSTYMRTGDASELTTLKRWIAPNLPAMIAILSSPDGQAMLPAGIRPAGASASAMGAKSHLRGLAAPLVMTLKALLLAWPLWLLAALAAGFASLGSQVWFRRRGGRRAAT